jgi:probable phosphoglycerate mutase
MVMNLYIVRHGQTDYNKMNMVQGSGIDAPINEVGRAQAAAFYQSYADYPFEKIYTSKLQRTHQSVAGFIDQGLPVESLEGLNEISWGDQEGVAFTPESSTLYQETTKRWAEGNLNLSVGGGETPLQVMERQQAAMQHILSQDHKEVLICMHGRAMRILICWLLKYDLSLMDEFKHSNLCLYKLVYNRGNFRVDEYNNTRHLEDLDLEALS